MTDRKVKVTLVIDETGAVRAMKSVGNESDHVEKKFKNLDKGVKGLGKSFEGLKGLAAGALGGLGASGLIFGLSDIAKKTGEVAEETEKFSAISGLGATTSLRFEAALKARGVSTETVGRSIFRLGKNIQLAEQQERSFGLAQDKAIAKGKIVTTNLGQQAKAFQALGTSATKFSELSESQKIQYLISHLSSLHNVTERNTAAQALLGRGATALVPVLNQGALGFQHQYEMAKKFFPELKGGTHGFEELLVKQSEAKMAWEGLELTLGLKLVPVMSTVFGWLSKTALEVEHGNGFWGEMAHGVSDVATAGAEVIHVLKEVGKYINVPLGGGTIGAALAAFTGAKVANKLTGGLAGKAASKAGGGLIGKVIRGGEDVAKSPAGEVAAGSMLPYAGAFLAGAALPFASAKGIRAGTEGIFGSNSLVGPESSAAWQRALFGVHSHPITRGHEPAGLRLGGGFVATGGRAAGNVGEATAIARLLEHPNTINRQAKTLTPHEVEALALAFARAHEALPQQLALRVEGDTSLTRSIADALRLDPQARRQLAEGVTQYAQTMTARK